MSWVQVLINLAQGVKMEVSRDLDLLAVLIRIEILKDTELQSL